MGEYYSECGRYDEAIHAFTRAKGCPHRTPGTSDYNIAIVLQRQGRHAEALALLESIPDDPVFSPPPQRGIDLARALSFLRLSQHEQSMALVSRLLSGQTSDSERAALLSWRAESTLELLGDGHEAERIAKEALTLDKTLSDAHRTLRRARGRASEAMRRYRPTLEGKGSRLPRARWMPDWFLVRYDVIAETLQEALEYASEFEDDQVCADLRIQKVIEESPTPDEFAGVEWTNGVYIVAAPKRWTVKWLRDPSARRVES